MTAKTEMVHISVTSWLGGWQIRVNGKRVSRFAQKKDATACAVFLGKMMPKATVKVHNRLGKIREEWTYPSSADPEKTKG